MFGLGFLLRVAHAHGRHVHDIDDLTEILSRLSSNLRLSSEQAIRVREAQEELLRVYSAKGRLEPSDPRGIDRRSAVEFVLKRRTGIRDPQAASFLSHFARAASQFARTYRERSLEQHSADLLEPIQTIYEEVREGRLTMPQQLARIVTTFADVGLALLPQHVRALVRSDQQIKDAGGPRDCALQRVGVVFQTGETTMRQRQRLPALPRGVTYFAFGRRSELVDATVFTLRALGWEDTELDEFGTVARRLHARRHKSTK